MGSVYRRSLVYCRTCKSRLSTIAAQKACRSSGHDVQVRESAIWTIQYQDASGLNQTESSKTSDKKKAQRLLRLREGAVARRERIVVEDLDGRGRGDTRRHRLSGQRAEVVDRRTRSDQAPDCVLRR